LHPSEKTRKPVGEWGGDRWKNLKRRCQEGGRASITRSQPRDGENLWEQGIRPHGGGGIYEEEPAVCHYVRGEALSQTQKTKVG